MKLLPKRTVSSIILITSLAVILIALAVLQYRWSGQISEAEQERMQTSLLASMNQFRAQFNNELQRLGFLFQPDASILNRRDWARFAADCEIAFSGVDYNLVRSVYLWIPDSGGGSQLLKLDRDNKNFEGIPWPAGFRIVRNRFNRLFANPVRPVPEIRPFVWTLVNPIPLMVRPLIVAPNTGDSPDGNARFIGCVLIELNLDSLRKEFFPELARKYFGGPDGFIYHVGIITGRDPESILYQSDPEMPVSALTHPDARISLLESPRERLGRPRREGGPGPRGPAGPRPPLLSQPPPEPPAPGGIRGTGPVLFEGENAGWVLVAQHRKGSLEAAVMGMRRRNLALSTGILLLLSFSMALIVVSARRAQRLARLQIDFVAGISHELRTPLAVICSAGDNLAEGVTVGSMDSTRKYGELVRSEGRKLAGMVDQTLQFAGIRRGRHPYNTRPESINRIAAVALKQAKPVIEEAGFSVEKSLAAGLPSIKADAAALSRAVQNLIQNAVKYSGENRRLAVRTFQTEAKRGTEVVLAVEDEGPGIAGEDLPHIFEPFYRGGPAENSRIHGTGLGLFIAREAVVSMGGRMDVKTAPGKGSTFTVHFPALPVSGEDSLSHPNEDDSDHAI